MLVKLRCDYPRGTAQRGRLKVIGDFSPFNCWRTFRHAPSEQTMVFPMTTTDANAEARELLGGPSIYDPGRFGVAISYDKAVAAISDALSQRDKAIAELEEAKRLLKPFADQANLVPATMSDHAFVLFEPTGHTLFVGDLRRAASFLGGGENGL